MVSSMPRVPYAPRRREYVNSPMSRLVSILYPLRQHPPGGTRDGLDENTRIRRPPGDGARGERVWRVGAAGGRRRAGGRQGVLGRADRTGPPDPRQHLQQLLDHRPAGAVRPAGRHRREGAAADAGRRVGDQRGPEGLDDQDQAGAEVPQRRAGDRRELRRRVERRGLRSQRVDQQLLLREHRGLRRAEPGGPRGLGGAPSRPSTS